MKIRVSRWLCVCPLLVLLGACDSKSPSQPSGTGSVTAPRQQQPANGAQIRNAEQPVTLSVANALVTQTSTTTYAFEVATDAAFANKVQTKTGIAEGSGGKTSLRLDQLAPGVDYYWHAQATGAGTVGVFGQTYKFTVGPAVVLNAPVPLTPVAGAATGSRPALTVTNAPRTGPASAVVYRFEVSTSPAFTPLAIDVTIAEGAIRTTYQPIVDLPAETTLYWRASATDRANGVSSPASAAASFVTSLAIDLRKVVYLRSSPDVSDWPQTANLMLVEQDGGGDGAMCMQYTDPGWPDSPWPFGGDDPNFGVYANQWYFAKINGTWYGGAGEWIYRGAGSCKAGQGTYTIGPDSGFGPPFSNWAPKVGELVGFMVSSVARLGVRRTVDQRSNVIVQPWRDTSLGSR